MNKQRSQEATGGNVLKSLLNDTTHTPPALAGCRGRARGKLGKDKGTMHEERITIRLRRDTGGNLAPVKRDGTEYAYIGTRFAQDGTPLETAWGHTAEDVLEQITPTPF